MTNSEPLLFLPGFMCDARLFWHQILAFSASHTVIVARLEGHSVEQMAEHVLAAAPPRFALIGHWLGALVAMEILKRAPDRVTQIAMMDVSPLPETPLLAGQREQRIVSVRAGRLDTTLLDELAGALAPSETLREVQAMVLEMGEALGVETYANQSRALMRRPDLQRTLHNSKHRALFLCGEHDTLTPPRRHEFLAELMPHGSFKLVSGAGHLAPLEQPERVTRLLQDWLAQPLLLK